MWVCRVEEVHRLDQPSLLWGEGREFPGALGFGVSVGLVF